MPRLCASPPETSGEPHKNPYKYASRAGPTKEMLLFSRRVMAPSSPASASS